MIRLNSQNVDEFKVAFGSVHSLMLWVFFGAATGTLPIFQPPQRRLGRYFL